MLGSLLQLQFTVKYLQYISLTGAQRLKLKQVSKNETCKSAKQAENLVNMLCESVTLPAWTWKLTVQTQISARNEVVRGNIQYLTLIIKLRFTIKLHLRFASSVQPINKFKKKSLVFHPSSQLHESLSCFHGCWSLSYLHFN